MDASGPLNNPNPAPKSRGRPRASYAQTGELDLSLIREYRNRPSLYDRNSKRFKDKMFTAQQWQIISHKLGYDVSLLKDRMLQLRNRYNIEKRRLENLREENNDDNIASPWPLFDSLNFLSEHIRSRRSYKHFEKKNPDYENSDENYELVDDEAEEETTQTQIENIMPDVKLELEQNTTDDELEGNDAEEQLPASAVLKLPGVNASNGITSSVVHAHSTRFSRRMDAVNANGGENVANNASGPTLHKMLPSITIRRVDSKNNIIIPNIPQHQQQQQPSQQQQSHLQKAGASPPVVPQLRISSPKTLNHNNNATVMVNSSNTTATATVTVPTSNVAAVLNGSRNVQQCINATQQNGVNIAYSNTSDDDDILLMEPSTPQLPAEQQQIMPQQQQQQHATATKRQNFAVDKRPNKYQAFGDFIGTALMDMPTYKALGLIEKFTLELVRTMSGDPHDSSMANGGQ